MQRAGSARSLGRRVPEGLGHPSPSPACVIGGRHASGGIGEPKPLRTSGRHQRNTATGSGPERPQPLQSSPAAQRRGRRLPRLGFPSGLPFLGDPQARRKWYPQRGNPSAVGTDWGSVGNPRAPGCPGNSAGHRPGPIVPGASRTAATRNHDSARQRARSRRLALVARGSAQWPRKAAEGKAGLVARPHPA